MDPGIEYSGSLEQPIMHLRILTRSVYHALLGQSGIAELDPMIQQSKTFQGRHRSGFFDSSTVVVHPLLLLANPWT